MKVQFHWDRVGSKDENSSCWIRVASIWAGHQGEGEPRPPAQWVAEDALITRPHADVAVRILPEGGFDFALALRHGASLGEAAAPLAEKGVDPGHHLVGLIESGALSLIR